MNMGKIERSRMQISKAVGILQGAAEMLKIEYKGRAVPLPFQVLDECCSPLMPGALMILTGVSGKSFALLQCILHWHELGVEYVVMMREHARWWHLGRLSAMLRRDARLFNPKWLEAPENNAEAVRIAREDASVLEAIGSRMVIACDNSDMTHASLLEWINEQAQAGKRVICVDPVTALDTKGGKVFELDRDLVTGSKAIACKYNCSVLFVSHPRGRIVGKLIDIDDIAGGRAYGKFSQCVIWLEQLKKKKKESRIHTAYGVAESIEHNAIWHILKVSNGPGAKFGIGFNWIKDELRWAEQGLIL